ncbi:MAG TPA: hypothetical protein VFW85_02705 [Gaiellaceae bacterium]|nr:hypothetical protein [Gaiellaceae bacterium]
MNALSFLKLLREVKQGDARPLAVAGMRELVPVLARELRAGGDGSAIVEGRVEGACALVWVGGADESALHDAWRARIPIVAVSDEETLPYVLDTDIVRVERGQGFPVEAIAVAVAKRLGTDGTALAARLPVLRGAVCAELIESAARRNGMIGAAVFIPGVDMPVLTLNQARLVLRIGLAYGQPVDQQRLPELLGVLGAGFGLRAVARELLDAVPVAGWALKGGVAYGGTKAIGAAAVKYFEERSVRSGS